MNAYILQLVIYTDVAGANDTPHTECPVSGEKLVHGLVAIDVT